MADISDLKFFIGNTNLLSIALTNGKTGEYVVGAAVSVTLQDSDGVDLSGDTWPKTMDYDADGRYEASLSHLIAVSHHDVIYANISATSLEGAVASWTQPVVVVIRDVREDAS